MNQNPSFFQILNPSIFQLSGKDSARYLNARLSNNVCDLPAMQGCAAAALSAQGRCELFGTILKFSSEKFTFVIDGGSHEENKKTLLRYKVADRVDCFSDQNTCLLHVMSNDLTQIGILLDQSPREWQPVVIEDLTIFTHQRTTQKGWDIIGSADKINALVAKLKQLNASELSAEEQLIERVKAQRPSFPIEINEESIFLEFPLPHAISFTKGCYVGQEVMEKVDSHGRLPYTVISLVSTTASARPENQADIILASSKDKVGALLNATKESNSGVVYGFARIKTSCLDMNSAFIIADTEFHTIKS